MDYVDIHSPCACTCFDGPDPLEDISVHGKKMRHMKTVDEFTEYCDTHDLDLYDQKKLLKEYRKHVCNLNFCEALEAYQKRVDKQLEQETEMPTTLEQPQTDVATRWSETVSPKAVATEGDEPILTFRLTEQGKERGLDAWKGMLNLMVKNNHLPHEALDDYMKLLGVTIEFKHYSPLKDKVPFYSSYSTLTFWICMMMGKMEYPLVEKNGTGGSGVTTHTFKCPPLISAPRGQYCMVLQNSVYCYKRGVRCDITDTRSLITAKKKCLKTDIADSILKALTPLGCKEV